MVVEQLQQILPLGKMGFLSTSVFGFHGWKLLIIVLALAVSVIMLVLDILGKLGKPKRKR